ncbi:hypothetical protein [Labrys sp. 22185]|uniref:hypothetical protein n=1 Tax=Labrys sp. 22185 TaxID=3453888 RepID=UPI003F853AF5
MTRRDHYADFYSQTALERSALEFRKLANRSQHGNLNVADFVEQLAANRPFGTKGLLVLKVDDFLDSKDYPGFVRYSPFEMHIDQRVWQKAKKGDAECNAIVAHELAHAILHDNADRNYSDDPEARLKYATKEYSSEWQAITWSDALICPEYLLEKDSAVDVLIEWHNIDKDVAARRATAFRENKARSHQNKCVTFCSSCGQLSAFSNGITRTCMDCGHRDLNKF